VWSNNDQPNPNRSPEIIGALKSIANLCDQSNNDHPNPNRSTEIIGALKSIANLCDQSPQSKKQRIGALKNVLDFLNTEEAHVAASSPTRFWTHMSSDPSIFIDMDITIPPFRYFPILKETTSYLFF
jgi:hypothetical protein